MGSDDAWEVEGPQAFSVKNTVINRTSEFEWINRCGVTLITGSCLRCVKKKELLLLFPLLLLLFVTP